MLNKTSVWWDCYKNKYKEQKTFKLSYKPKNAISIGFLKLAIIKASKSHN
ncbi:hypothetical protein HMPREF1395_00888 [Helicobacter pylori GAM112Ai]|nr:hypothetical protein HMPREF1395_00888 [Helicobacter pylori GAM112Ai]EMH32033.1 hypothetical protein HMPREF1424_01301 [Helicobacter pylori GAM42Ai]